jgi:NAD(P)-dependent dehydrogenase (short-subunit alcohol dehydrogenase family)
MLADAGAHVVMACRSAERAKGAVAEVTSGGGKAEIIGRARL